MNMCCVLYVTCYVLYVMCYVMCAVYYVMCAVLCCLLILRLFYHTSRQDNAISICSYFTVSCYGYFLSFYLSFFPSLLFSFHFILFSSFLSLPLFFFFFLFFHFFFFTRISSSYDLYSDSDVLYVAIPCTALAVYTGYTGYTVFGYIRDII